LRHLHVKYFWKTRLIFRRCWQWYLTKEERTASRNSSCVSSTEFKIQNSWLTPWCRIFLENSSRDLLGYDTVYWSGRIPTFRRAMLPPSSRFEKFIVPKLVKKLLTCSQNPFN
jgi:hypothetical protein